MTPDLKPTPFRLLPQGSTDTHAHVFDPAQYGYDPERAYTPGVAPLDALHAAQARYGIERMVLVQPSVYGVDNRCMLAAIERVGQDRGRGIAVVDLESTTQRDLDALHVGGVRGIRLNLKLTEAQGAARVRSLLHDAAALVQRPGWCVQVHGTADVLNCIAQCIDRFQVPIVLDHFAGLGARHQDERRSSLQTLLRLLDTGGVYVKLSAPYRVSDQAPEFTDLDGLVRTLIDAHPQRMLWGSDWPHTGGDGRRNADLNQVEPFRHVDLAAVLRALTAWAGDATRLRQLLVDNPAKLYGFTPKACP